MLHLFIELNPEGNPKEMNNQLFQQPPLLKVFILFCFLFVFQCKAKSKERKRLLGAKKEKEC